MSIQNEMVWDSYILDLTKVDGGITNNVDINIVIPLKKDLNHYWYIDLGHYIPEIDCVPLKSAIDAFHLFVSFVEEGCL